MSPDGQPDPELREALEGDLRGWQEIGLIQPGWTVRWDAGVGAWRCEFRTCRSDLKYDLPEVEMELFRDGVAVMAQHLRPGREL